MHYILKNTSLRCTNSLWNKMYGWHIQQYQSESFLLPLVRHHSYKNEQYAIQGCNTPSRKCTAYSWRIQPFFVQYSLQPNTSFERGSNCAEHTINLSNICLYFYIFTKLQYTIYCRKQDCFQDAWSSPTKKNVQDTAVFSRSACLKFQLRFHAQNVLFPCKCVTFFLRQNIDDAWKRSRFNCS